MTIQATGRCHCIRQRIKR